MSKTKKRPQPQPHPDCKVCAMKARRAKTDRARYLKQQEFRQARASRHNSENVLMAKGVYVQPKTKGGDRYANWKERCRGRQKVALQKRQLEWEWTRNERRREVLGWLREAFAEGERMLCGWDQILQYLADLGGCTYQGEAPRHTAAQSWVRRHGMPVLAGSRGIMGYRRGTRGWSSTYLIQAWLVSLLRSTREKGGVAIVAAHEEQVTADRAA